MDPRLENAARWRAWRVACEEGLGWTEAYDRYLHPATRIGVDDLLLELGVQDSRLTLTSARSA